MKKAMKSMKKKGTRSVVSFYEFLSFCFCTSIKMAKKAMKSMKKKGSMKKAMKSMKKKGTMKRRKAMKVSKIAKGKRAKSSVFRGRKAKTSGGSGQDEKEDENLRRFAVNSYIKLLEKAHIPDIFVQLIAWVLGEYARLVTVDGYGIEDVIDLLTEVLERSFEDPNTTRGYIVSALMKLVAQDTSGSSTVTAAIEKYRRSQNTDLQQRCSEFVAMTKRPDLMRIVLPYDASCEDFEVDAHMSFLDTYVNRALQQGMKPYQTVRPTRTGENGVKPDMVQLLKFLPYETPQTQPKLQLQLTQ